MKTFRILPILMILLLGNACEQVLDIDADGTISGDVLVDNASIDQALIGAYYSFGGIADGNDGGELLGGDFVLMTTLLAHSSDNDISWDDVNGPAFSDFIDKDIQITNTRVEANWRRAYEVINTVNTILANIERVSGQDRERINGEALAIRGILYFEMARLWAPQYTETNPTSQLAVPILLEPINDISEIQTPTIATLQQVYDRAEDDLTLAANLLSTFGTNGTRLSQYACWAYLARLNLQKGLFSEAFTFANDVIQSGAFTLVSSPLDAFGNTSNTTEDIFAIQQSLSNTAGDITTGTGIVNYFASLGQSGVGAARILLSSFNSTVIENSPFYQPIDLRASVTIDADRNTPASSINTAFYNNVQNASPEILSSSKWLRGDQVLPVVRLAEMHLIRAETLFEENPLVINDLALDDLNAIRTRAGLSELTAPLFVNSFAFYDSIQLERRRELLYEGHLLHDSKRLGNNIGSALAPIDANAARLILPIPQSETDTGTGG